MFIINNSGSQLDFARKINLLVDSIIKREERGKRQLIFTDAFSQWGHRHIWVPASSLKIRGELLFGQYSAV